MKRNRTNWTNGDIFGVPLKNGSVGLVQIVDTMLPNIIYVAISSSLTSEHSDEIKKFQADSVISLIAVTRHAFDFEFKKLGHDKPSFKKSDFKNELTKSNGYIGSVTYDAGLIIDFLNAYNKLTPWDDWHNPNYLDSFLVSDKLKPTDLIYKVS